MTARLSLYEKAEHELYKLDRSVKGKFYDFCHRFRQNPDHPGLDLKPLKGDGRVFRAKIDQSYRALLAKAGVDEHGQERWLVVAVRHRKHVYEELSVAINRVTGEIEFVDLSVVGQSVLQRAGVTLTPADPTPEAELQQPASAPEVQEPVAVAAEPAAPLLSGITGEDLRSLGVAVQLIDLALAVTESRELDQLVSGAPLLTKDILYGLAAGMSVDEVRREITAPVEVDLDDTEHDDLGAALARTTVTTIDDDLRDVLEEGDFRAWKVFLHPAQAKLVERRYNGPARVSGGPGTGKTIVALHRVKHLAQQLPPGHNKPILLTTFTTNLTVDLRARLSSLLEPELVARVEITNIDKLAARVLNENALSGTGKQRVYDSVAIGILQRLLFELDEKRWEPEFLYEEWEQVVLGQSLGNRKAYFDARRAGRGRSVSRPERAQIWKILEQFTARLDKENRETWGQAAERAARFERERAAKVTARQDRKNEVGGKDLIHRDDSSGMRYIAHRYQHVVVDEAQDLRPAHWKMLRAMVAPGPDDMFIAGDTYQRIYDQQVTLGTVGVNIRGRSSRLTLSYRTTKEILARAMRVVDAKGNAPLTTISTTAPTPSPATVRSSADPSPNSSPATPGTTNSPNSPPLSTPGARSSPPATAATTRVATPVATSPSASPTATPSTKSCTTSPPRPASRWPNSPRTASRATAKSMSAPCTASRASNTRSSPSSAPATVSFPAARSSTATANPTPSATPARNARRAPSSSSPPPAPVTPSASAGTGHRAPIFLDREGRRHARRAPSARVRTSRTTSTSGVHRNRAEIRSA